MSERRFLLLLLLWLAAHAAIRIAGPPVLGPDGVEQAIFTQSIDWSHGFRQPPLYTWLLAGQYALLGPGLAAHLLLRYAPLFLTAFALHRIALRLLGDGRLALTALQLLERPGMGGYLALGLLAGIGVLTRYSYLVFLSGLYLGAPLLWSGPKGPRAPGHAAGPLRSGPGRRLRLPASPARAPAHGWRLPPSACAAPAGCASA